MDTIFDAICAFAVGMVAAMGELVAGLIGLIVGSSAAGLAGSPPRQRSGRWWRVTATRALAPPLILVGVIFGAIWIKNIVDPPTLTERAVSTAIVKGIDLAVEFCKRRAQLNPEHDCVPGE
jgi:hypothetical protein